MYLFPLPPPLLFQTRLNYLGQTLSVAFKSLFLSFTPILIFVFFVVSKHKHLEAALLPIQSTPKQEQESILVVRSITRPPTFKPIPYPNINTAFTLYIFLLLLCRNFLSIT